MLTTSQKVFGLGLSKTGTSSLNEALNILGVRSIHYPHDEQTLAELKDGNYQLSLLEKYQGLTDLPAVPFYAQFDRAYPGSKFILTVRESTSWLHSCQMHWQLLDQWQDQFPEFKRSHEFLSACVYGTLSFSRDRFAFVYEAHALNVQRYFQDRNEDFLLLDICGGEGWERLCPFLELQKPEVPFPHANEWMHLLMDASKDLDLTVPRGATMILVDEQGFGKDFAADRRCLPFLEREGDYWGAPADDATALAEFERMLRSEDPGYIVIGWPAYWWLDQYPGFSNHLRSSFRCVMENERVTVFDLNAGSIL